jgi:hypothetical protein
MLPLRQETLKMPQNHQDTKFHKILIVLNMVVWCDLEFLCFSGKNELLKYPLFI